MCIFTEELGTERLYAQVSLLAQKHSIPFAHSIRLFLERECDERR